jgi:hypothetical protein
MYPDQIIAILVSAVLHALITIVTYRQLGDFCGY